MLGQLPNLTALDLCGKKVTAAMLTVAAKQPFASRLTSFSYCHRLQTSPPPSRPSRTVRRTQAWPRCCQGKRRDAAAAQGLATH